MPANKPKSSRQRDDFSPTVKRKMAERVAWRCSFPGCQRLTIGPNLHLANESVNLGNAAHIHAASRLGPRYREDMTSEERRSILNGIWMCTHHANIIDKDFKQYAADSLRLWKQDAERRTYIELERGESADAPMSPMTWVQIGENLIFEAKWVGITQTSWQFEIGKTFVQGDLQSLIQYCLTFSHLSDVQMVLVESQGDGRVISEPPSLERNILNLPVAPKWPVTPPEEIGSDLALSETGDILLDETNDLKMVSGKEAGLQFLRINLNTEKGEWFLNRKWGTHILEILKSEYPQSLKNRLAKLELVRLATMPIQSSPNKEWHPALDFINRILDVQTECISAAPLQYRLKVQFEWSDTSPQMTDIVVRDYSDKP